MGLIRPSVIYQKARPGYKPEHFLLASGVERTAPASAHEAGKKPQTRVADAVAGTLAFASPTTKPPPMAPGSSSTSSPGGKAAAVGGEAGKEGGAVPSPAAAASDHAPVAPDGSPGGGALPAGGEAGKEDEGVASTGSRTPLAPGSSSGEGALGECGEARNDDEAPAPAPRLIASPTAAAAAAATTDYPHEGGEAEQEGGNASSPCEEQEEGDDDDEEEEAPTHLPFAPSSESELPDDKSTVDPSFTISLIRKLVPQGPDVDKELSVKQGRTEEKDASSDVGEPKQPHDKDLWDNEGCKLWDLSVIEPQAELMVNNLVLEVLLANLHVRQFLRAKEICIGIIGNLACHKSLANAITSHNGLIATVVDQLFLDDPGCLTETFRLLSTIFQSNASMSWAEALLPDEILSRIMWIIGNTVHATLLQKILEFLSALVDDQDVITILIEPLIKVGLVDCAIGLLLNELEKSMDGNNLDRSDSLDSILRLIEELSAIDNCSKVMSSNDQLIKALSNIVKLPDKFEVEGYCASVVIIIANVLSDGEHLTPILSHDLPLLEGLFDILPLISDDNEARNAFWCILTRLLQQVEGETITNSSKLEQFVSIFLAKFTLMKDDIERHGIQTEADSSVEGVSLKNGLRTSLKAICSITERWIADKSSLGKEDASLTENTIENAKELLTFCRRAMGIADL
uniref:Uncharacterized protein n=1 Tax=Oryza nivara TaxID=4536 RepID=A0A0E0GRY4_ORYNI